MKELTLPVICRNALTIVALVNDFVNPSFLGLIKRAKAHFCPNMLNNDYLNVPFLLLILTALAKSKRGLSKFHTIVLRLVGIKVHDNTLPNMMWREVDMAAVESECLAGLRVWPLCCHNPPTAHRASFYLNLGDRGFDSPVDASPLYLIPEGDDEAGDEYEGGNRYDDEESLCIHRRF